MKLPVARSEQECLGDLIFICFSEGTSFSPVHIFPCNKISSPNSSGSKLDLKTGDTGNDKVLKVLVNQSRTGTDSRRKARLHCPTVFCSFKHFTYTFSLQKHTTALVQSLFKAGGLYQEVSCLLDDSVRLSWQVVTWLCALWSTHIHILHPALMVQRLFFLCQLIYKLSLHLCVSLGFFCPCLMGEIGTAL